MGGHVEDEQLFDGRLFFAGHHIFVGLERWSRFGDRVDDPKVFYLSLIRATHREVLGIRAPEELGGFAFVFVFFLVDIGLAAALDTGAMVGEILHAIGG